MAFPAAALDGATLWLRRVGGAAAAAGMAAARSVPPDLVNPFGHLFEWYTVARLGLRHFTAASEAFKQAHPCMPLCRDTYDDALHPADRGIDALSADEATAYQIKWRSQVANGPGRVTQRELGTFTMYVEALRLRKTVAVGGSAKLAEIPQILVDAGQMGLVDVPADRFEEFCRAVEAYRPAAPEQLDLIGHAERYDEAAAENSDDEDDDEDSDDEEENGEDDEEEAEDEGEGDEDEDEGGGEEDEDEDGSEEDDEDGEEDDEDGEDDEDDGEDGEDRAETEPKDGAASPPAPSPALTPVAPPAAEAPTTGAPAGRALAAPAPPAATTTAFVPDADLEAAAVAQFRSRYDECRNLDARPCQDECYDAFQAAFAADRPDHPAYHQALMACGTGKSLVWADLLGGQAGPTALFVPNLALLEQAVPWLLSTDTAPEQPGGLLRVVLVGTEDRCRALERVANRAVPGGRVGTLDGSLGPGAPAAPRTCYVSVYNSVDRVAAGAFDLVVVDEAHHLRPELGGEDVRTMRARIKQIRTKHWAGFSATPSEHELIYRCPLDAAIQAGYLADYCLLAVLISPEQRPAAALCHLLADRLDLRHVLAYTNSTAASREFCGMLAAKGVRAATYDSTTNQHDRRQTLAGFYSGAIRVLATCHVLGEGFDLPLADTCMFVEPRGSPIDVVQCLGRCLRRHPSKTIATVILPTSSEDRDLGRFAHQIRARDARWAAPAFRTAHIGAADERENVAPGDGALENYRTRLISRPELEALDFDDRWNRTLALVAEELRQHGTVPQKAMVDGQKIGWWVGNQRAQHTKGTLRPDRQAALERTPGWTWGDDRDGEWTKTLALVAEELRQHGTVLIKAMVDGQKIGVWVSTQRFQHMKGTLRPDRQAALERTPGWTWGDDKDGEWVRTLALVAEELRQHGTVPNKAVVDGQRIGLWVNTQRVQHTKGTLRPDRQAALERTPGWTWGDDKDGEWTRTLALVAEELRKNNTVPQTAVADGRRIGTWVSGQRRLHAKGTLRPDRQAALERTPGWIWGDDKDGEWIRTLALVAEELRQRGTVPQKAVVDGQKIGVWVSRQRVQYAKGTLRPDRRAALERTPGWTWGQKIERNPIEAHTDKWTRILALVAEELRQHGTVSQKVVVDGQRIGLWVNTQRVQHTKGTLRPDRQAALERTPGWTWGDDKDGEWTRTLALVAEELRQHGTVPKKAVGDGQRIGEWVSGQRRLHAKGTLRPDRQAALERTPGWIWGDDKDGEWIRTLALVAEELRQRGTVPQKTVVGGQKIGEWVSHQRVQRAKGTLRPDRQAALERTPGWTWGADKDGDWARTLALVAEELRQHGTVPIKAVVDGQRIGLWVSAQRVQHARGTLRLDRQAVLERTPGWTWGVKRDQPARAGSTEKT